jgi:UDP-N-acetylglucosamine 1-carboxyvinyltransferase
LDLFAQLGVKIEQDGENYILTGKPKAGKIVLNKLSVTATENAIMATVLSEGITRIQIAAAEPEIADLAQFLNKMGAKISGAGTHEITIEGVKELKGISYSILPDRIEAGTYLIAAIATNSKITIGPLVSDHLSLVLKKITNAGAKFHIIEKNNQEFIVTEPSAQISSVDIDTRTYPGFPTDLQSPFAVLMTGATGDSQIFETIFEGRFLFIEELKTMGADIEVLTPHIVQIHGPAKLKGREIISRDLRGCAALVIAGLVADGTTIIEDVEYVDRGYEKFDEKLQGLGASIRRIN